MWKCLQYTFFSSLSPLFVHCFTSRQSPRLIFPPSQLRPILSLCSQSHNRISSLPSYDARGGVKDIGITKSSLTFMGSSGEHDTKRYSITFILNRYELYGLFIPPFSLLLSPSPPPFLALCTLSYASTWLTWRSTALMQRAPYSKGHALFTSRRSPTFTWNGPCLRSYKVLLLRPSISNRMAIPIGIGY